MTSLVHCTDNFQWHSGPYNQHPLGMERVTIFLLHFSLDGRGYLAINDWLGHWQIYGNTIVSWRVVIRSCWAFRSISQPFPLSRLDFHLCRGNRMNVGTMTQEMPGTRLTATVDQLPVHLQVQLVKLCTCIGTWPGYSNQDNHDAAGAGCWVFGEIGSTIPVSRIHFNFQCAWLDSCKT